MNRRDWLAAVAALGTLRGVFGEDGVRPRIGICAFSCHQHWNAVSKGKPAVRFHNTVEFLRYARELGFEGVQCGFRPAGWDRVREIRRLVDGEGLYYEGEVKLPVSDGDLEGFETSVRAAKEAGAAVVRAVFTGGRRYEIFKTREEFETFTARARRSLELAEPVLARHRLRLAVENHKDHTSPELVGLIKGFSSEWIGVLVDTGNNLALLESPEETLEALAPFATSVHLKDMAVQPGEAGFLLSEVPLGTGALDLKAIVAKLKAANPGIVFNLEMATRDPLVVPCSRPEYFATFPDRRETHFDRMMEWVASHPATGPVPRVSGKDLATVLAEEEQNNLSSLGWMKDAITPA